MSSGIDERKSLKDFFGNRPVDCNDPVAKMFFDKIKDIHGAAVNRNIHIGEALVMINKNFGYIWETIPYGRMDDVRDFIVNNYFRAWQYCRPQMHDTMIENVPEYKQSFAANILY